MTHTLATLEVFPDTYADIRSRLEAAGHDHAIDPETGHIDMTGIALAPLDVPEEEVATMLTAVLSPELVERMKAFAESAQVHRELVLDSDDERPTDPEP